MSMKKIVYITVLSIVACLWAAIPAFALTPAQQQQVISSINTAASGLETMECTFLQTKHLSLLSDRMVSEGRMYYVRPGKLRWEYTTPYRYLFIFSGSTVYVGNESRADVIDTNTNKVFKEVARIMMNTVTGRALAGTTDFTIAVEDAGDHWKITLTPRKRELKQLFSKIEMSFNKDSLIISSLNIIEKNRDKTTIEFTHIATNEAIDADMFVIP